MVSGFHFEVPDVIEKLEQKLSPASKQPVEPTTEKPDLQIQIDSIFKPKVQLEDPNDPNSKVIGNDDDLCSASSDDENAKPKDDEAEEVQDRIGLYFETEQPIELEEGMKEEDLARKEEVAREIKQKITKSFIPSLFKHLTDQRTKKYKKEEDLKVRTNVAVCIVKLLRKTDPSYFQNNLSKLIRTIVVCLRSRLVSVRDIARDALTQVNLNISPYLLHVTIDEMFKTLTRGYQRHVRSFTLHHILDHLEKEGHLKVGQIDHCLDKYHAKDNLSKLTVTRYEQAIPKILMDELFGALGAEKELGTGEEMTKYVHIKESRANRTLSTYEIIAKYINFDRSFVTLIRPIIRKAETSAKHTNYKKCEEIMDVISGALLKNTSVKADSLLVVLYAIMKRGTNDQDLDEENRNVNDEKFSKKTSKQLKIDTIKVLPQWSETVLLAKKKGAHMARKILVAFALNTLKKSVGSLPIEQYKDKLDSFCGLYIGLMKSTDNRIVINTLHLLSKCIKLNLPSLKFYIRKIINNLFMLFQNSSESEFINSLFKCTAELVRCMKNEHSEFQIKKLVEIIKANLEHYSMQANVYGCLKAIVEKRVLTPDVYDLIEIIGEKMITNSNKGIRSICSKIYVQFLIEYPLEEKRIEQHIYHLIKNINYFDQDGRETVLEVLDRIVTRFPTEILDKFSFILFLTLILRTVNETNKECKQKANLILKSLLENVSDSKRDDIIKTVLTWDYHSFDATESMGGMSNQAKEAMLKRITFLLIGLIITIEGDKFATRYFDKTIELLLAEFKFQNDKFRQILTHTKTVEVTDHVKQLEIVKKEMAGFFDDIDEMVEEEKKAKIDISSSVSKQELMTVISTLSIVEKLTQNKILWTKLYDNHISSKEGYHIIEAILELSKLVSMFEVTEENNIYENIRRQFVRIWTEWFKNMEEANKKYKNNECVTKLIDDLTMIMIKYYKIDESVIGLTLQMHNIDSEVHNLGKLEKMISMYSFAGRRIMMKIKKEVSQLTCIMKFFISSLNTIKNISTIKCLSKPMLHLGFKVYTNPQLAETETKAIAAELVECLQNKLDYYDTQFERVKEDDKSIANSTFLQMYTDIKNQSEINKKEARVKRKINKSNDPQRHKRKRSEKRKKKRTADKKEREKFA
jgi:hypothetical protein